MRKYISILLSIVIAFSCISVCFTSVHALSVVYYIDSVNGDDSGNGLSETTAWKSLSKANSSLITSGTTVKFACGSVFRGNLDSVAGVTYTSYGTGEKPTFLGSDDGSDASKWNLSEYTNVWVFSEPISCDIGIIVFNGGELWGIKKVVGVNSFTDTSNLDSDLEFWHSTADNKVYIYSEINPAVRFSSIEMGKSKHVISLKPNTSFSGLRVLYGGAHGMAGTNVSDCTISDCEIGWTGGSIQHGTTRYGNGIEFWLSCNNVTVENCHIYQIYDAGVTHQASGSNGAQVTASMTNVTFRNNLIEYCTYSYEYFLSSNTGMMENVYFTGNTCRHAGLGWGAQRPDPGAISHIISWEYPNKAINFVISGNVFEGSTQRLFVIYSTAGTLPMMSNNTYLQYEDSSEWTNENSLGTWDGDTRAFGSSQGDRLLMSFEPTAHSGRCAYPVNTSAANTLISDIFGSAQPSAENFSKFFSQNSEYTNAYSLFGFGDEDGLCDYLNLVNSRKSVNFTILQELIDAAVASINSLLPLLKKNYSDVQIMDGNGNCLKNIRYTSGYTYGDLPILEKYGYDFNSWQLDSTSFAINDGFGITANVIYGSATDAAIPCKYSASVNGASFINSTEAIYEPAPELKTVFEMSQDAIPMGIAFIDTDGKSNLSETGLSLTLAAFGSAYHPRQIMYTNTDVSGISIASSGEYISGSSYHAVGVEQTPRTFALSGDIPQTPTLVEITIGVRAYHPTWENLSNPYGVFYVESIIKLNLWIVPQENTTLSGAIDESSVVLPFDHSLIADWTPITSTINFDANGGEAVSDTLSVNYGGKYGVMPEPQRDGFYFDGWQIPEDLGDTVSTSSRAVFGTESDAAIRNDFTVSLSHVMPLGESSFVYNPIAYNSAFEMNSDDAPTAQIVVERGKYNDLSELPLRVNVTGHTPLFYPRQVYMIETDTSGITASMNDEFIVGSSVTTENGSSTPATYTLNGTIPTERTAVTIAIGVRAYHPTWNASNQYGVQYFETVVKIKLIIVPVNSLEVRTGTVNSICGNYSLEAQWIDLSVHPQLTIAGASRTLVQGEAMQLSTTILPASTQKNIVWSSSNPYVASVNQSGLVTGHRRGFLEITAAADDGSCSAKYILSVLPSSPTVSIENYDGDYTQRIDWWKKYSTATMSLFFKTFNCDEAVRYVWSSSSKRVRIDQMGNITNTGSFSRSSTITLTVYDAENNVVAKDSVTVRFYKFSWQQSKLQSQSIVSDNIWQQNLSETELELRESKLQRPELAFLTDFVNYILDLFKVTIRH